VKNEESTTPKTEVKIGHKVTWLSQSNGSEIKKTGTVVAFLEPNEDLYKKIPPDTSKNRIKGQRFSQIERILVEVHQMGRKLSIFYTPRKNSEFTIIN
jgi:hypothetical protein